ncbi:NADPH-dependent FMN reductase [Nonomuraea aurantiaca]|jgi:NAD(P)H-dependent FMN reductase|uniref:NADPH-dependent FMN reductase n=1 Tax=Nonomuraea aurantiaca TaxID=2878562 RepID=UPI001CD94E9C|nr:NAD(P)H-dependent oxidoreductase [Nonomuraea aurantiaca]MCA2227631.1 NAD(P)H-dependent oxidoreductase [Nonomuraea aurantiaca]
MSKPVLQVVIASTRPGRVGRVIGEWFYERAVAGGDFDVELIDLAEVGLPFLDEPNHPKLKQYEHAHTKEWSAIVERGDAYVFVTPEYNHSFNAVLKNALDFLHQEWQHKAAGFVSYGGLSGGTRAVNSLRQVVSTLKMIPVVEAVNVPFVPQLLENGTFKPNDMMTASADALLAELAKLTSALRPMRLSAA